MVNKLSRLKGYLNDFGAVLKNFSYTLSYQILYLILPIITVPYITRVFTQETVCLYTVISANCSYFVLFGMLGIALLGPREIAKCLGDRDRLSITFSNIYKIQFLSHIIAIVAYIVYCILIEDGVIKYLYLLYLISSLFDISWFFIGIEDFKNVSIRNIIIKLVSFTLLFLVVKSDTDIYKYVCTLYVPQIVINIYMWYLALSKYIRLIKMKGIDKFLLKETVSLFLPQVASSIYTILDKTVLGIFTTYTVAAIYSQGQTLLKLFLAVVPSFCKVMAPRVANCLERKADDEVNKYMTMSANVIGFLSFLLAFGIFGCSELFVAWYLPEGYSQTSDVLRICAPIIIFVSGANLISVQYLIPKGEQRIYTISVFSATGINLILNFGLAPIIGIYGVCIGSVVAEATGFIIQLVYVKRYLNLKTLFMNIPIFVISGLIMLLVIDNVSENMEATFISIALLAIIGAIVYSICSVIGIKFFSIIKKKYRRRS